MPSQSEEHKAALIDWRREAWKGAAVDAASNSNERSRDVVNQANTSAAPKAACVCVCVCVRACVSVCQ